MRGIWRAALLSCLAFAGVKAQSNTLAGVQWPLHNDGNNTIIEWDHYSFLVNGQRLYIFGGEFHYWRYPVPEMWEDLLLKIKAAGFNSFSIYSNWAYHSPSPDVLDFTSGSRNFSSIFALAKKIGLYVLYRPGPYVNAETNAGGFPLWLTTGAYGELRNNDTRYTAAWKPYMEEISKIVAPYLITNGGNVIAFQIENELGSQWVGNPVDKVPNGNIGQYMESLEDVCRANGINIPLSFNNPNMNADSWSQDFAPGAEGNVDVVGLDSYPSCWSCNLAECTSTNGAYVPFQVVNYYDYFTRISPTQPNFMPEFQGGSYNPWGGPEGGCPQNSDQDFANLFYRHNVGERVTAQNLYMLYGGTSWAYLPAPVVATSYDYSAPITESREIAAKYYETKLLALFFRAAKDLPKTDRLGNSTIYTTNANIYTRELRNPDTNAAFYVTIHANSSSSTTENFQLHVNTSAGPLSIPRYGSQIVLNGHQSKIIVTDFTFSSYTLLYSTAEVLSTAVIDSIPTIAFWVPTGESGEIAFKGFRNGNVLSTASGSKISVQEHEEVLVVAFTQSQGYTVLDMDHGKARVLLLDRTAAYKFWAPSLTTDPFAPDNQTVFVHGPYLVRSASVHGSTLALSGDVDGPTNVTVFASSKVESITWNGKSINRDRLPWGALVGNIGGPATTITLPALTSWKSADALPERKITYDDSGAAWKVANDTTTPNPAKPFTLPVLYVDQYGFHTGISLFRAHVSGNATSFTLGLQGGIAFGFSAFFNSVHVGSFLGNSAIQAQNMTFTIPPATLPGATDDSVLLVVMDNSGHALRSGALDPRGILLSEVTGGTFTSWKIAGTAGGEANIDPVRGPLSEGGLTSERLGWHLPGFDASSWNSFSPSVGTSGAGVTFYRTTAKLDIPKDLDVSIVFTLTIPSGSTTKLRAILWVNGYNYGLFNPYVGNQVEFPVPTGILNLNGVNTIALSVWNQDDAQQAAVEVGWKTAYVHESGYDFSFDASALRPGWNAGRQIYV